MADISVMWFRRDLRLADHPALRAAVDAGPDGVVPLFVLDPGDHASRVQHAYLGASLKRLSERVDGLHLVEGRPVDEVVRVARRVGADSVHVTADHEPDGSSRDDEVAQALAEHDIELVRAGSPYAVPPGRAFTGTGSRFKVFTPFYAAWREHGWPDPEPAVREVPWLDPGGSAPRPTDSDGLDHVALPAAGEEAARRRWRAFLEADLEEYDTVRDEPGADRTSRMSVHLHWGEIHPRTMLADLGRSRGAEAYRRELAFREFYADVLDRRPDSAWGYYDHAFEAMPYDDPGDELEAWKAGRTGFPIVDAGMRQLLGEGWMHNRVRMIVASFLVKDLHLEWQHGARHFAEHLVDFDLASNQHGWQWVAGCGTDASPYFRVFNPTTQGKKFDPDGTYVRRWVPALADVPAKHVHEPHTMADPPADYPRPIVDHAEERRESLRRYEALRDQP